MKEYFMAKYIYLRKIRCFYRYLYTFNLPLLNNPTIKV